MSEPDGSSEDNLQRVREKVMQLAREIERMSGENHPPNIFFQEFLNRVVMAIGARSGAVWMLDDGRLGLAAQVNLQDTGLRETPGAMQKNERLLVDVLQTGEARTLVAADGHDLPTEHVLVLSALHREKECVGVVQLFQRTAVPEKARSGYMQFLEQMCGYASRYIEGKRHASQESADLKSEFWTSFEQFTLRIQRSLDEQEVSDAAASDGRPLLNCDRMSIATRKGRSVRIRAVSGQSSVNHRANLVTAMAKLARRVIESGETLTYKGKIEGLPPQIEKPLADFVQESGSRMVMLVPTFENQVLVHEQGEDAERKRRTKRPSATGCLVIEQVAETEPSPQLEQRAELLADHIGAALWNSRTHNRIFGLSLWKLLGKGLEWFHGRKLAITSAVLLTIAAVVAAMGLIRVQYPVDASGKMMPVEQHAVFALWDGEIKDIWINLSEEESQQKVERLEQEIIRYQALVQKTKSDLQNAQGAGNTAGVLLYSDNLDRFERTLNAAQYQVESLIRRQKEKPRLRKGDLLVVMENDEEAERIRAAEAELNKQSGLLLITSTAKEAARDDVEIHRYAIELQKIQADLAIASEHLNTMLRRQEEKLKIRAVADGIIPNFQIRQLLQDRPVHQGDHLFDIMDDQGEWHMELLVEEKRMGHVLRAMQERIAEGEAPELEAEFYLATQPDSQFRCRLVTVSTRSTTDPEMGTAFELVCVAEKGQDLPDYHIGSEVEVRIYCSECSLAYSWFGDVLEFLQRFLWV